MPGKYIVRLIAEEQDQLQDLVSKGKTQAYRIRHAHILLKVDADGPAWLDREITDAFSSLLTLSKSLVRYFGLMARSTLLPFPRYRPLDTLPACAFPGSPPGQTPRGGSCKLDFQLQGKENRGGLREKMD